MYSSEGQDKSSSPVIAFQIKKEEFICLNMVVIAATKFS